MGSKWRKVKLAIGINMCVQVPKTVEHSSSSISSATPFSDRLSPSGDASGHCSVSSITSSASGLRLSRSKSNCSKGTCAICLNSMKAGQGHAIFTAECSHSFHFQCITSNVKHGNRICPVCRAKWKEVPFQSRSSKVSHGINRVNSPRNDSWTTLLGRVPTQQASTAPQLASPNNVAEPAIYDDDDEVLDQQTSVTEDMDEAVHNLVNTMEIRTYPEVSAIAKSASHDNFAVLIHLKAPPHSGRLSNNTESSAQNSRAPIDLVTVLDVSGSMSGTKIALLKRAMGFVIQNLSSSDRLSVITFSCTARRIFPLRRMTDAGKQEALQAVNSLVPNGVTNIVEGLRKGAKVFVDRKWKNPVGSIILLSDGQDSSINSSRINVVNDYRSLVPCSIHRNNGMGLHIPVHAFGFGVDHDATAMHSISEISGGTFSFIEDEDVIQDAFAQCIGGLLSVVVQQLHVEVQCVHRCLQLGSVKAGSYQTSLIDSGKMASIKVGDLYAEEEKDFLVTVNVPVDKSSDEMSLMIVRGIYRDPITKEMVGLGVNSEVKIQRPNVARDVVVSIEVDKQRNRLRATEAMAEARVKAERGDLSAAVSVLERCQQALSETISAKAGDELCISLAAEMKEMQDRMVNQRVYEQSGRAYVLSGLCAHSWQRATARGDSTDSTSFVNAYRTPSMVDMVSRSQTMLLRPPQSANAVKPARSYSDRQRRK
ncbi:E3 ubiquitin-protein ligase WAV3-like [Glycine soja]|uniref:E3 ubiquitin-protein ligase WAV3 isoform A n=1 Tax=Glycine soja TaxID=3848 RepID=A0A445HRR9_GLYSO|nr:E3 ubiquitin-protein ligase WAV3-like [Glycine soja]RZB76357.1 E3 ubiquitin-protein ligase WAV3 isoform A [Glycine soja]RZB76358.1 E3 ubiquitin-protein ligase WAV3 isoform B [Glycine soja]